MKTIKLIKKFVEYSSGTPQDVKRIVGEFREMGWKKKTLELKRMKEILNG